MYYQIITFADGSTIVLRVEGTLGGGVPGASATGGTKQEIIKGTGRFEGIKGTGSSKVKFFPLEKWDPGAAGVGEGTLEYTLPSK